MKSWDVWTSGLNTFKVLLQRGSFFLHKRVIANEYLGVYMCVLFITNSTRWTCTCHLRLQVRVTCQILSQGCVWLPASLQAVCKSFTHTTVFSWWLRVYQHPLGMKFFIFFKFIYLFMAALGFRCCMRAFSSCGERGLLFVAVHGLLIVVASLVAEHRL